MIGAGSVGFSLAIARELVRSEILKDSTFVLMDIDSQRLAESEARIKGLIAQTDAPLRIESTLDRRTALTGAHFVVNSCAPHRMAFWAKDIVVKGTSVPSIIISGALLISSDEYAFLPILNPSQETNTSNAARTITIKIIFIYPLRVE